MRHGSFVLGYHGCDRALGEKVLAGEVDLVPSNNDYDWLGSGIYFWENNPQRALDWARLVQRHGKRSRQRIREPFVIGAVLDLGECLDLLESSSIRLVEDAYDSLSDSLLKIGAVPPVNVPVDGEPAVRRLDCAVIEYTHRARADSGKPPFDAVRAAFPEGAALYPGAGFQRRTHIQISVRSTAQIIGYFRLRTK